MEFPQLPLNSRQLLCDIVNSTNPVQLLCDRFNGASRQQNEELRGMLRELREAGYVDIKWGSDVPYVVTIHNAGRTYIEQLAWLETANASPKPTYIVNSNSVTIGDGNRIYNSTIAGKMEVHPAELQRSTAKSFSEKHPIIIGVVITLIAGFILTFSFWERLKVWIEGWF